MTVRRATVADLLALPYEEAEATYLGRGRAAVGDDVWQAYNVLWRLGAVRWSSVAEWCEHRSVSPRVEKLIAEAGYAVDLDPNRHPVAVVSLQREAKGRL